MVLPADMQPSRGKIVGYSQDTTLGSAVVGTQEVRYDEFSGPTDTRVSFANPNIGHRHARNVADKSVKIEKFRDAAINLTSRIRRYTTTGNTSSPIADYFESAGCVVQNWSQSGEDAITYVDTTDWDLADDVWGFGAADAGGVCGMIELNSGVYYPVLCALWENASKTITPGMALPSASTTAKDFELMTTITPRSRQVPVAKTLCIQQSTRGEHTNALEDLSYAYIGCALASVDEMTIVPSEPVSMGFTFHCAKVDQKATAIVDESFIDGEKFPVTNDDFFVEFAAASAAGGIARGDMIPHEVKINFALKTVPIIGEGNGTVGGIQGYMASMDGPPKITITGLWDATRWVDDIWTQYESTTEASKYIGIVQGTRTLTTPAWGFWMPNAYIDPETPPQVMFEDEEVIKGSVTYIGDNAGYNSETDNDEIGAAPWYFAISGAGDGS